MLEECLPLCLMQAGNCGILGDEIMGRSQTHRTWQIQTQMVFASATGQSNMIQVSPACSQAADTSCVLDSALSGITRLGGMQVSYSFLVLRGIDPVPRRINR